MVVTHILLPLLLHTHAEPATPEAKDWPIPYCFRSKCCPDTAYVPVLEKFNLLYRETLVECSLYVELPVRSNSASSLVKPCNVAKRFISCSIL